jgi:hypothetical protein
MSPELRFLADREAPSKESFLAHFRRRSGYEIDGDRAIRFNRETGVRCEFVYAARADGVAPPDGWASVEIDRPLPDAPVHDAVAEIREFVAAFPGPVLDPATGARGPFDPARLTADGAKGHDGAAQTAERTPRPTQSQGGRKRSWFGFFGQ